MTDHRLLHPSITYLSRRASMHRHTNAVIDWQQTCRLIMAEGRVPTTEMMLLELWS